MTNAYILAGPMSSGNRLLASILIRSGCFGDGSTNQPGSPDDLPAAGPPLVIIKHWDLYPWVQELRAKGYQTITVIVLIREPIANARSMASRGHCRDFEEAYQFRTAKIATNITEALSLGVNLEIITYEGLSESFLAEWLPRIGLPYVPGDLSLPGQAFEPTIQNQNAKHY